MRELSEVVSTSVALATGEDRGVSPEGRTSQLRRSSTWNPTLRVPPVLVSCKVAFSRLYVLGLLRTGISSGAYRAHAYLAS